MSWSDDIDVHLLPFPVAFSLRKLLRARRAGGASNELDALLDLVEETMRFVNARLMAEHLVGDVPFPAEAVRLIGRKQTFGDRTQLANHLAGGLESLLAKHIRSTWAERQGGLGPALAGVVKRRNEIRHGARPGEETAREHLDIIEALLPKVVPLFHQLQAERLYSIYRPSREPGQLPTVMPWIGPFLAVDEVTLDLDFPAQRSGTCITLVGDAAMPLGPFFVARDEPLAEDQDLWVFDHGFPDIDDGPGSIRWSNSRVQKVDIPSSVELLASMLHDLANALAGEGHTGRTPQRPEFDSHYFATTPALISRLMSTYVERPEVDGWMDELVAAGSGSLWIEARAGAGKSSVMAHLCKRFDAIHHFVSASEGRSNVPAILRSMIIQLATLNGFHTLPSENNDDLSQQLANLLVSVALSSVEPTIIAVDALDELGSARAVDRLISALPDPMPEKTCLVITSRPMPPSWRVPRKFIRKSLGPMSIEAVQAIARRHGITATPEMCAKAFTASQGNPLFCLWALRVIEASPQREVDFSHDLEDYFGPLFGMAFEGEGAGVVQRVMAVLVAAGSPVDLPTLVSAASSSRTEILRCLDHVKSLVVISDGKLSLMHKVVADYLSDPANFFALAPQDLHEAHGALAAVALAPGASYPASMAAYHLVSADAIDDLISALEEPDVAGALPQALLRIADSDGARAIRVLEELADRGGAVLRTVLRVALIALIESGQSHLVDGFLTHPASAVLGKKDRAVVDLWRAAAADNYGEVLAASDRLLADSAAGPETEPWGAECLFMRGQALRIKGRTAEALETYQRADTMLSTKNPVLKFRALFQIADLDYVYGRLGRARTNFQKLDRLTVREGMAGLRVRVLRGFGNLDLAIREYEAAAHHYTEALDVALFSREALRIAECYVSLAQAQVWLDAERSLELVALARHWCAQTSGRLCQGKSYYVEAEAHLRRGDIEAALAAGRRSLLELTEVGYGSGIARAHAVIAECMLRKDPSGAVSHAEAVLEYYEREQIYPMLRMAGLDLGRRVGEAVGSPALFDSIDSVENVPHLDEFPQFAGVSLPAESERLPD